MLVQYKPWRHIPFYLPHYICWKADNPILNSVF
jgi:hypothetical protein